MARTSDFLLRPEPIHDCDAFTGRITTVLARGWPTRVDLAPSAPAAVSGWRREHDARLILLLEGAQRHEWRAGKTVHERRLVAGEALWLAPGALVREDWTGNGHFLGIVLRPHFLRFLIGRSRGEGRPPSASPWAHHASLPLGEPGSLVARALDRLAEGRGDPDCTVELVRALLRLARDHAQLSPDGIPGKATATWHRVQEHIAAHCLGEIDRTSTARKLGLNPTYLSDVCQRYSGKGFARLVEDIRLQRARNLLLMQPDLPVRAIAAQVGFASAGYFARTFRRITGCTPVQWRGTGGRSGA